MKNINFKNLKDVNKWKRLFFMMIFVLISRIVRFFAIFIGFSQFLVLLFSDSRNDKLLSMGNSLSRYTYDIMLFITYNSEERPFPFSDWPGGGNPFNFFKKGKKIKKVN